MNSYPTSEPVGVDVCLYGFQKLRISVFLAGNKVKVGPFRRFFRRPDYLINALFDSILAGVKKTNASLGMRFFFRHAALASSLAVFAKSPMMTEL